MYISANNRCCSQGKHESIHSGVHYSWNLTQYSYNLDKMVGQCLLVDTLDWGMYLLLHHRQDHICIHSMATNKLHCWLMDISETHTRMKSPNTTHKPQTLLSFGNWDLSFVNFWKYSNTSKKFTISSWQLTSCINRDELTRSHNHWV